MKTIPKGAYTLLITPFREDLSLDENGLRLLVQKQVEAGITGIAPLGVTGENTLLTDAEVNKVVKIIIEEAAGKSLVVPDTCESGLARAIERVKIFNDLGVNYISVFSPFFVLPKTEGVIDFYTKIADISKVPILLHNAEERTGINIAPETTAELAKHPNIAGIKDGNKKLDHLAKVVYLTRNDNFAVFTGKDTTAFPLLCFGGAGTFTVAGNVIPQIMKRMTELALAGDLAKASEIHYDYYELFEALRFETNPMAAKMALNLMKLPGGGLRPPLTLLSKSKTEVLKKLMIEKGLISE
ncbi:MAG: 4-hydroxy-tetrahydrodipicolinate synthase [Bacteroidia bacterium]|nr:4-hydroxy-tetrahydrodipicolinate synthase [Bacteroidia bacterium]